ncbi:MAG: hypothetical protein COB85_05140 [Bacteroidetes bacterium]|nr:MAG: hypothetical protein COB85_05140 [Bacteroidota bacterium]
MTFNSVIEDIKIVIKSIGKRGLLPTLTMVWHEYSFDSKYGIRTKGRQAQNKGKLESTNSKGGKEYQGYSYFLFRKFMNRLAIDFSQSVFVDFGSGKGRVLIMASEYNFKRIIGLEYAEDLFLESQINIGSTKVNASNIHIEHEDAAAYSIPEDANVLFFFNPFDEKVMESVLKNVDASMERTPRKIYIVYTSPTFETCFDERGYEKVFELHNGAKNEGIIYRV